MNKVKTFFLALSMVPWFLFGQSNFYMSNQTVDDCEGFFFDSDNGITPLDYGHSEDLTFSICPLGADSITIVFNDFCTEINNDVLRFFDGPDTFSSPIGLNFSGQIQIPPITATSGCLTIHFRSDASVSCTGWSAQWEAVIDEPSDGILTSVSNPLCQSNLARFT
ncbi:MAG: CUB domain-containing protein, partial [Bacteroidota bacterium]|nr:CUB domain-containing protein [Bacteroidota bacterium]